MTEFQYTVRGQQYEDGQSFCQVTTNDGRQLGNVAGKMALANAWEMLDRDIRAAFNYDKLPEHPDQSKDTTQLGLLTTALDKYLGELMPADSSYLSLIEATRDELHRLRNTIQLIRNCIHRYETKNVSTIAEVE